MSIEFKIEGQRLIAKRSGPGDWQDVVAAYERMGLMLERRRSIEQLLLDLSMAHNRVHSDEAPSLAELFRTLVPQHVLVAIVSPESGEGSEELERFSKELSESGRTVKLFETREAAVKFLDTTSHKDAPESRSEKRPNSLAKLLSRLLKAR